MDNRIDQTFQDYLGKILACSKPDHNGAVVAAAILTFIEYFKDVNISKLRS